MVSGIEGKFLDVHSQSGFVRVNQDAVMGKMVMVIPYFGVPLGLLGF